MPFKILMVDDEIRNLKAIQKFFEANDLEVTTCQLPSAALRHLKSDEFALILLDYKMPEMTGDVLAGKIRELAPRQQIVMFSCDLSREALKSSWQAGAIDFIEKNTKPDDLLQLVHKYCNRYELLLRTIRPSRTKSENQKIIESLEGFVGRSDALAGTSHQVHRLAKANDVSVLIRGESGTGKEIVAKAMHKLSNRSSGPFVAINCAAIPRDLLESELFGHKQGSFTGAVANHDGKFLQANRGTIFLDEIGDLPLELQAKLLRVLQERVVEPVGSTQSKKIDVRAISATHRNIDEMVKAGSFREDLKYRLNVVEIEIPPLRERPDDIEPLLWHFTEMTNSKQGFNKHFQAQTLPILKAYAWPGNVRELAAVVESHLIECPNSEVLVDDLNVKLFNSQSSKGSSRMLSNLEERQSNAKMDHILNTIEFTNGNKAEAARLLGITPSHLQYLLNNSKAAKRIQAVKLAETL